MESRKNKNLFIAALLFAVCATTVAFAALQTTLTISGTVTKKGGTWNINLQNVHNIQVGGDAEFTTDPVISGTNLNFAGSLSKPNDSISFDVDLVNSGTVDAILYGASLRFNDTEVESFTEFESSSVTSNDITCSLLYDGSIIENFWYSSGGFATFDLSAPANVSNPTKKTVTIKCQYDNVASISSSTIPMDFYMSFNYQQAQ